MTKAAPSFRHIAAPLDIDDSELENLNEKLGVPTMVRPAPKQKANIEPTPPAMKERAAPVPSSAPQSSISMLSALEPKAPVEKLTIELPGYLTDALKREAVTRRVSVRHIVMLGLRSLGMEIRSEDMVADARRGRGKIR